MMRTHMRLVAFVIGVGITGFFIAWFSFAMQSSALPSLTTLKADVSEMSSDMRIVSEKGSSKYKESISSYNVSKLDDDYDHNISQKATFSFNETKLTSGTNPSSSVVGVSTSIHTTSSKLNSTNDKAMKTYTINLSESSENTTISLTDNVTTVSSLGRQDRNNEQNHSTVVPKHSHDVSLMVQLSGEFGNHLQKLAREVAISKVAKDEYNITTHVILKQRVNGQNKIQKAENTRALLQRCFDHLKPVDFGLGNRIMNEVECAQYFRRPRTYSMDGKTMYDVRKVLKGVSDYLYTMDLIPSSYVGNCTAVSLGLPSPLISFETLNEKPIIDEFYDLIRHTFIFNATECCTHLPEPDESVFHYRGFATELHNVAETKGFQELSPHKIANELFGHLQAGDKIAITGRFVAMEYQTNTSSSYQIISALRSRGLQVRVIQGGGPMEDFCFLKNAKKELVGMFKSSYVNWAFYLGNATITRIYAVDSPIMRRVYKNNLRNVQYNWTNPALTSRLRFEWYEMEGDTINNW